MSTRPDLSPITSRDDPRLTGMGQEDVAGADQIVQLLAVSPRERLQYLLDTLDFEDRLHQARRAATLHGSPLPTRDTDVCPSPDDENLDRLAAALRDMGSRIRTPDAPEGIRFACDAAFLRQMKMLNLTTRFGDLDLSFEPSGTGGYEDLAPRAVRFDLGQDLVVPVAALEDVIRSKEAANREKDRQALPALRLLLEKIRHRSSGR